MVTGIIGQKINQSQEFLEDGTRIPVTKVRVSKASVVMVKTKEKDGYTAVQLAIGIKKRPHKALLGHIRGARLEKAPLFLREVRLENEETNLPKAGDVIKASDVFKQGDIVDVIGISKGKGFAGVVKRHHFKGGPRTHGQSDRERAPGSIGQTTTPGRVYRGKRMAGRMGRKRATAKNLQVVDVQDQELIVKGLIPGAVNSLVMIKKMGESKKFTPIYKAEEEIQDGSEKNK